MREVFYLVFHLLTTLAKLIRPGGSGVNCEFARDRRGPTPKFGSKNPLPFFSLLPNWIREHPTHKRQVTSSNLVRRAFLNRCVNLALCLHLPVVEAR